MNSENMDLSELVNRDVNLDLVRVHFTYLVTPFNEGADVDSSGTGDSTWFTFDGGDENLSDEGGHHHSIRRLTPSERAAVEELREVREHILSAFEDGDVVIFGESYEQENQRPVGTCFRHPEGGYVFRVRTENRFVQESCECCSTYATESEIYRLGTSDEIRGVG